MFDSLLTTYLRKLDEDSTYLSDTLHTTKLFWFCQLVAVASNRRLRQLMSSTDPPLNLFELVHPPPPPLHSFLVIAAEGLTQQLCEERACACACR